mgnify:FL=1
MTGYIWILFVVGLFLAILGFYDLSFRGSLKKLMSKDF